MKKLAAALLLISVPAFAQQSPTTTALQINNAVSNMALTIEQNAQTIKTLQQQLATAQAEIKQLKDKYEPKEKSDAKQKP